MKITRSVIVDLWAVYVSGEASADTRALVEEFLRGDRSWRSSCGRNRCCQPSRRRFRPITRRGRWPRRAGGSVDCRACCSSR